MCVIDAIGCSAVVEGLSTLNRRRPQCFLEGRRPVMRILSALLALSALMAFGSLLAADEPKADGILVERIQDLNLTDDQETKIADIIKEFRPKNMEAIKELADLVKEEMEKVRAVLTAAQKEKLETLREERKEARENCLAHRFAHLKEVDLTDDEMTKFGEIRKEFRPRIVKAMQGLEGLLTDAQKKAREEGLQAGKKRKEILQSLNLTDEQKEKVTAAAKEMSAVVREEMEKIREVLTASQKEKFVELKEEVKEKTRDRRAHRIANLKDLDLTDEQKTKFAEIRKDFGPKIHEAGNKVRASVREEVEMILAVIKG
jgi:Spy/CpxP family protein refolding chaperone